MIRHVHVLIVDDDPILNELLAVYLDKQGYSVTACADAEKAVALLSAQSFDLIVSDIEMPGTNGIEFLERIRADYPNIGVVLMTAYEASHPRAAALRAGADGYITKPFSLREFTVTFERAYWNALSRQDELESEALEVNVEDLF